MSDEGHRASTCTFRECNGDQSTPCPFLSDAVKRGGSVDRPTFLPGQVVMLKPAEFEGVVYRYRMAVMIGTATQRGGQWIYRTTEGDNFRFEDVERKLTT